MKPFFDLECGRHVVVDAFYYFRTYISLLEGRPNRRMNDDIITKAKKMMQPLWGERRTHVIPPAIDESDPAHPCLPPVCLIAWLTCFEPIVAGNTGSELVVVWFREEFEGQSMGRVIADGIQSIRWEELAADFEGW